MAGIFANQSDIENVFGIQNTRDYSNLDNTAVAVDPVRIQKSLNYADQVILFNFGRSNVNIQAMAGNAFVTNWAASLAGAWMYASRGQLDKDNIGNQYTAMVKEVMQQIAAVASGRMVIPNYPANWPAPSAPVAGW